MRKALIALGTLVALLSGCVSPPPGSPPPSAKTDLFEVEATFTGAISMAGAYVNLPACGLPNSPKVCKDPGIAGKIDLAVTSATAALATAERLILGCTAVQYVAATATPPTGACGQPVADQTAQQQALTAVQSAVNALQAAIPIIQSGGN